MHLMNSFTLEAYKARTVIAIVLQLVRITSREARREAQKKLEEGRTKYSIT